MVSEEVGSSLAEIGKESPFVVLSPLISRFDFFSFDEET